MTTFRIPMPPAGFQRPRPRNPHNLAAGFYNPHQAHIDAIRPIITNGLRLAEQPIIEGPVAVAYTIDAQKTIVEIAPVVGDQPARPRGVRQDLDNIVKLLNDALNGLAFYDDKQIVDLKARFR